MTATLAGKTALVTGTATGIGKAIPVAQSARSHRHWDPAGRQDPLSSGPAQRR